MNAVQLRQKVNQLTVAELQQILDGRSLIIDQDTDLIIGNTNVAFVLYFLGDDNFTTTTSLKDYLLDNAQDLILTYYKFNPLSKRFFNNSLLALMKKYGENNFVAILNKSPKYTVFAVNGELVVSSVDDYKFKYGMYLQLEEDLNLQVISARVKNWVNSNIAYQDYISINIFRFSS